MNNKLKLSLITIATVVATNTYAQTFYQCMPLTCKDGQYINGNNCVNCSAGTYQKGNNRATACTPCPAGTYSSAGAASCTSCPTGQYQNASGQGSCKKCTGELLLGYVRWSDSYKYKWLSIDSNIKCHKSEFTEGSVDSGNQWCCAIHGRNDADRNICAASAGWYDSTSEVSSCNENNYNTLTMGCDKVTGELYVEGCLGRVWAHQTQLR